MNAYFKYLTRAEQGKIYILQLKIKNAKTVEEVNAYDEQIGLILERIIIRRSYEFSLKK